MEIKYFKDLYQETHNTPEWDQMHEKFYQLQIVIKDYQNPLDYEITEKGSD